MATLQKADCKVLQVVPRFSNGLWAPCCQTGIPTFRKESPKVKCLDKSQNEQSENLSSLLVSLLVQLFRHLLSTDSFSCLLFLSL